MMTTVSAEVISIMHISHIKMSASSYIKRDKLNESKRIIKEERIPIKTVAIKLGYATVQHFSRCFKAEFGISPSKYARLSDMGDE